MGINIENELIQLVVGFNGQNLHFIDKRSGRDYCVKGEPIYVAWIKKQERYYDVSQVIDLHGQLLLQFGDSGVTAAIRVETRRHTIVFEVIEVSDSNIDEIVFINFQLELDGKPEEPFAATLLALNLQTNVLGIPGLNRDLRAACYPKFGLAGAKAALIGCPMSEILSLMQETVQNAEDLPHSPLGGPWALQSALNRGSYLFDLGSISEETVDEWIDLARSLGMNQIDFHGGLSFRFGDCKLNPELYPNGRMGLKKVIDKLHQAGIAAGLHTYAFFMDKQTPWVTPVPDSRLAKDSVFTLAAPVSSEDRVIPVFESTANMSALTGFSLRNSATFQIDDELIVYSGVSDKEPYQFTDCERGAYGTQKASHSNESKVYHLKECFGLFVPDGESTLFAEVAAETAEMFNECGFDMIYLDALDGEDIIGGGEHGWHYGSKFVFELWKRLERPALMEMSTFHHHLWYVRSRANAWDTAQRGFKPFIDIHAKTNEVSQSRNFLPGHLGWWCIQPWNGTQSERTFSDDIEYLCCKSLSSDTGFSIMLISPESLRQNPTITGYAAIIKNYETLRHLGYFPESIKAKLRVPGEEFTLVNDADGEWKFVQAQYDKHKIEGLPHWSNIWKVHNKFENQPLKLRIEVLSAAESYESTNATLLFDYASIVDITQHSSPSGAEVTLQPTTDLTITDTINMSYQAVNKTSSNEGVWTKIEKEFDAQLDLNRKQALGVWIHGDGQGEVINFQLGSYHESPSLRTQGDHYVNIDFKGWRYFQFIEHDGGNCHKYSWPYNTMSNVILEAYSIYREPLDYSKIDSLTIWFNNIPANGRAECIISPVKALPLTHSSVLNPSITIEGKTIVFPIRIETGSYLEMDSSNRFKVYGPEGEMIGTWMLEGDVPLLTRGENLLEFGCDPQSSNPRLQVTVISNGERL